MTRDEVYLMRRKKKIKLKDIALHLQCSVSLISMCERGERNFNTTSFEQYKEYIINK